MSNLLFDVNLFLHSSFSFCFSINDRRAMVNVQEKMKGNDKEFRTIRKLVMAELCENPKRKFV